MKAVREYDKLGRRTFEKISRFNQKTGSIIKGITAQLNSSELVIADLTGLNPNVMYELGVRHSLRRGTIIITQELTALPSDLRDYMSIEYSYSNDTVTQRENYNKFRDELHHAITELLETEKPDSPVLTYLGEKQRNWKEDEIKKFNERLVISRYIREKFKEIESLMPKNTDEESIAELNDEYYTVLVSLVENLDSALRDLDLGLEDHKLYEKLRATKSMIDSVRQKCAVGNYFGDLISLAPNDSLNFQSMRRTVFQSRHLNHFELSNSHISFLTMSELFSRRSPFETVFLKALTDYLFTLDKSLDRRFKKKSEILASA
jgi:hypothetical protein